MPQWNGQSARDFLSDTDTIVSYSQEITKRAMAKSKLKPFIGVSSSEHGAMIKATHKTTGEGNIVTLTLEDDLIQAGATGNVTLNASAEELKRLRQLVSVSRFQHSVPSNEDIVSQRSASKFKSTARDRLGNWATIKLDRIILSALSANLTNIVASNHHEDLDTQNIAPGDILTTKDIEEAKRRAIDGVDAKGNEAPPLVPIKIFENENAGYYEELEMFVLFVGTNSAANLKKDPNWREAQKAARERGKDNPLFSGALGFWDGVLVLDIKSDTERTSGILRSNGKFTGFGDVKKFDLSTYAGKDKQRTEINLFLGASAGQLVVDKGIQYYEYDDKDDPRRMNIGIDRVMGFAKTKFLASANDGLLEDSVFNEKDYGVIGVISSTGRAEV